MTPVRLLTMLKTCRDKAKVGGLPLWRQCLEIGTLFCFRGLGPGYYLVARFWRREIPFRDKWRHCNDSEYRRYIVALNPENYRKASQHKVIEKATLTLFGLPTPRFLGFLHPTRGRDVRARPLRNSDELEGMLRTQLGRRVCFKPVEGYGGSSFSALDVHEAAGNVYLQHPLSGERHDVPNWYRKLQLAPEGWLLEEYLQQHPLLAAINATSVNTARILVIEERGEYRTRGAFLRVGRTGSQVDNTSRGGLACPIDIASGRIVEAIDMTPARNNYKEHPDSGTQLIGLTIPHWPECMRLAGSALALFPQMSFAGLDIAVTEEGPSVIELNVYPDRRGLSHLNIPHKNLFNSVLPQG